MTTVTSIPKRNPFTGLRVSFSIRSFMRAPATRSKPSPMYFMPKRKAPMPPKSVRMFPTMFFSFKSERIVTQNSALFHSTVRRSL